MDALKARVTLLRMPTVQQFYGGGYEWLPMHQEEVMCSFTAPQPHWASLLTHVLYTRSISIIKAFYKLYKRSISVL